jgi:hypothetical protein
MGRRRSSRSYNAIPQAAVPPTPPPQVQAPAVSPLASPLSSLLSKLVPPKTSAPVSFTLPPLPVGELAGGISNTARGLVMNGNWWILLLIIFLFFPNLSSKMFGGILKD